MASFIPRQKPAGETAAPVSQDASEGAEAAAKS
ncbi:hypothetical protein QF037_005202 [Streptomyces canus]|nr:hypothetical protein [Streptomyces canus]